MSQRPSPYPGWYSRDRSSSRSRRRSRSQLTHALKGSSVGRRCSPEAYIGCSQSAAHGPPRGDRRRRYLTRPYFVIGTSTTYGGGACSATSAASTTGGRRSAGECTPSMGSDSAILSSLVQLRFSRSVSGLGACRADTTRKRPSSGLNVMSSPVSVLAFAYPSRSLSARSPRRPAGGRQSVGRDGARVADHVAAADRELPRPARRHRGAVPIPDVGA